MPALCFRYSIFFVLSLTLFLLCSITYSQSEQKRLEKASKIIISNKLDSKLKLASLKELSEDNFCNDVNSIIRLNNKAIYYIGIGSYGNAKTLLNAALGKEIVLKSHLDNSVLEYNRAISNLFPGKNFCFTKLDSAKQSLLSLPLKHEAFGLNYYIGMAEFYKGNFANASSYFQADYNISSSGRALFSLLYSKYLMGAYDEAYSIYS